jgi:hypothetical protein
MRGEIPVENSCFFKTFPVKIVVLSYDTEIDTPLSIRYDECRRPCAERKYEGVPVQEMSCLFRGNRPERSHCCRVNPGLSVQGVGEGSVFLCISPDPFHPSMKSKAQV